MEEEFLLLAFYLSVLTYYLGTLVYALPVPWRGLKRWGPALIYDGASSAVLVFAFTSIVVAVRYLYGLLGGSWDTLYSWLEERIAILLSYEALLSALGSTLSGITGIGAAWWALNPLLSLLSYTTVTLSTIASLALVIQHYYSRLIALGIALYSVPFRLARTAGAGLIAFSIVFYVGLPLLPLFVDTVSQKPLEPPQDVSGALFVEGYVYASDGTTIGYAEIHFYDSDEEVAVYPTTNTGWFNAGAPDRGLPDSELKVILTYPSTSLVLQPSPVDPSRDYKPSNQPFATYHLDLRAPGIVSSPEPLVALIADKPYLVLGSDAGSSGRSIIVRFKDESRITLQAPSWIEAVLLVNGTRPPTVIEEWSWRNVNGVKLETSLSPGTYNITLLIFRRGQAEEPKLEVKKYLGEDNGIPGIRDLTRNVSRAVFSWIILPASYIAMLTASAYALSSLLGGRGRLPIPLAR